MYLVKLFGAPVLLTGCDWLESSSMFSFARERAPRFEENPKFDFPSRRTSNWNIAIVLNKDQYPDRLRLGPAVLKEDSPGV